MTAKERKDSFEKITSRIIDELDKGVVPWRKTWKGGHGPNSSPKNFVSKKPYRGINYIMLSMAGYSSPYWLTFNQAKKCGGSVNKGEKGTVVVLWKPWVKKEKVVVDGVEEIVEKKILFLRDFVVFNIEQTSVKVDAPIPEEAKTVDVDAAAQELVDTYAEREGITIKYGYDHACYNPSTDEIEMPKAEQFEGKAEYHGTLFHEAAHSTGHERRLDRGVKNFFGSEPYAKEELVAEITAAMLCRVAGVDTDAAFKNSVAYIQNWKKKLTDDKKLIVYAAAAAQKAVDLILKVDTEAEAAAEEAAAE